MILSQLFRNKKSLVIAIGILLAANGCSDPERRQPISLYKTQDEKKGSNDTTTIKDNAPSNNGTYFGDGGISDSDEINELISQATGGDDGRAVSADQLKGQYILSTILSRLHSVEKEYDVLVVHSLPAPGALELEPTAAIPVFYSRNQSANERYNSRIELPLEIAMHNSQTSPKFQTVSYEIDVAEDKANFLSLFGGFPLSNLISPENYSNGIYSNTVSLRNIESGNLQAYNMHLKLKLFNNDKNLALIADIQGKSETDGPVRSHVLIYDQADISPSDAAPVASAK